MGIEYFDFDLAKENKIGVDVGMFIHVLEHLFEATNVLKKLSNIKYLVIVVPNFSYIKERIRVVKGNVPYNMNPERGGHCYWFNKRILEDIIKESDYKILKFDYAVPNKIKKIPILNKFNNLFATQLGVLLENKN